MEPIDFLYQSDGVAWQWLMNPASGPWPASTRAGIEPFNGLNASDHRGKGDRRDQGDGDKAVVLAPSILAASRNSPGTPRSPARYNAMV
jgi:hypothetical protein